MFSLGRRLFIWDVSTLEFFNFQLDFAFNHHQSKEMPKDINL